MKARAAAMVEAIENKEIELKRIPGRFQLAEIGTKTLPKTVLYSLMYQMNMIDGSEAEEYVKRLEDIPKVKSIKIKELEVEVGISALFILMVMAVVVEIKDSLKFVWESIKKAVRWMFRDPEWEEEVVEKLNHQAETLEKWINERDESSRQESEWDVVSERQRIAERDQRLEKWREERTEVQEVSKFEPSKYKVRPMD